MASANKISVEIDPASIEVINLVRAANNLLMLRKNLISKDFDKFWPELCGVLHELAMATKAVERLILSKK